MLSPFSPRDPSEQTCCGADPSHPACRTFRAPASETDYSSRVMRARFLFFFDVFLRLLLLLLLRQISAWFWCPCVSQVPSMVRRLYLPSCTPKYLPKKCRPLALAVRRQGRRSGPDPMGKPNKRWLRLLHVLLVVVALLRGLHVQGERERAKINPPLREAAPGRT